MKIFSAIVIALLISACATAPKHHEIYNDDTINRSFDQVWTALIEVMAEFNLGIATIEKDSGIIATDWIDYYGTKNDQFCDCGGLGLGIEKKRIGKFNVFIKALNEETTMITVNSTFNQTYEMMDTMFERNCVSCGMLEKQIIDSVKSKLL